MARAQHVPEGPWIKTTDKVYWLNYATVTQQPDFTGNEYVQLQNDIRDKVAEASTILKEHNIEIFNVYTMQALDANMYDTVHRIAIGFAHKEDLLLAKMIIKCNV